MTRITVDPVTRIEGESEIDVIVSGAEDVEEVQFSVKCFRGFEKFLVGTPIELLPPYTARICGICYTAHVLASCKALEHALGAKISPEARKLRQLLHLGNFIESHALSVAVLSLPDFVVPDVGPEQRNIAFLLQNSELARRAISVRQLGSTITKLAGKRPVHPVSPVIGGVLQPLKPEERDQLEGMMDGAVETVHALWQVMWEAFHEDEEIAHLGEIRSAFMSLRGEEGVEFYDAKSLAILEPEDEGIQQFLSARYLDFVAEEERNFSYMKFPVLKDGTQFRVGPLARVNVCGKFSTPKAQAMLGELASEYGMPLQGSMFYHLARIAELMYALERTAKLLQDEAILSEAVKPGVYRPREAQGVGVVEAPRGTLVHIYDVDDEGYAGQVRLFVATQHNNFAINEALTETATRMGGASLAGDGARNKLEMIVRAYDPCLSCATH